MDEYKEFMETKNLKNENLSPVLIREVYENIEMDKYYLDIIIIIERLNYFLLKIIKIELDRLNIDDINSTQVLMIYKISKMNKKEVKIVEIASICYDLGFNITYNIQNLVKNNYLSKELHIHDKRCKMVKLTKKSLKLLSEIEIKLKNYEDEIEIKNDYLYLNKFLSKCEKLWGTFLISFKRERAN